MLSSQEEYEFRRKINFFYNSLRRHYNLNAEYLKELASMPIFLGEYIELPKSLYYEEHKAALDKLPEKNKNEIVKLTEIKYLFRSLKIEVKVKNRLVQKFTNNQSVIFDAWFYKWQHKGDVFTDSEQELNKVGFSKDVIQFLIEGRKTNRDVLKRILVDSLKSGSPIYPLGTSHIDQIVYNSTIYYDSINAEDPLSSDPKIIFFEKYNEWGTFSAEYIKQTFSAYDLHKDQFYAALFSKTGNSSKLSALIWIHFGTFTPLLVINGESHHQHLGEEKYSEKRFLELHLKKGKGNQALFFFKAKDGIDRVGHARYQYIKFRPKAIIKNEGNLGWPVFPEIEVRKHWDNLEAFEIPNTANWSKNIWLYEMIRLKFPDKTYKIPYLPKEYYPQRLRLLEDIIDSCKKAAAKIKDEAFHKVLLDECIKMKKERYIYLNQGMSFKIKNSFDTNRDLSQDEESKAIAYKFIGYEGMYLIFYNPKKKVNDIDRVIAIEKNQFIILESQRRYYQNLAALLKPIEWITVMMALLLAAVFAGPLILPRLKTIFTASYLTSKVSFTALSKAGKNLLAKHKAKILKMAVGGILLSVIIKSEKTRLFLTGFITGFVIDSFNTTLSNLIKVKNINKLIPYYGWIKFTSITFSTMKYLEEVTSELSAIDKQTKVNLTKEFKNVITGFVTVLILLLGLAIYLKFDKIIIKNAQRSKSKWQDARKKTITRIINLLQKNPNFFDSQTELLNAIDEIEKIFLEIDDKIFEDFFESLSITANEAIGSLSSIRKVLKEIFVNPERLNLKPIEEYEKIGRVVGKLSGIIYIKYARLGKAKKELGLKRTLKQYFKDMFTPIFKPEKEMENSIRTYIDSALPIGEILKSLFEILLLILKDFLNDFIDNLKSSNQAKFEAIRNDLIKIKNILEGLDLDTYQMFKEGFKNIPLILTKILSSYAKQELSKNSLGQINLDKLPDVIDIFNAKTNSSEEKIVMLSLGLHLTIIASKMEEIMYSLDNSFSYGQNKSISIRDFFSILSFSKFTEDESLENIAKNNVVEMDSKELLNFISQG